MISIDQYSGEQMKEPLRSLTLIKGAKVGYTYKCLRELLLLRFIYYLPDGVYLYTLCCKASFACKASKTEALDLCPRRRY